MARIPDGELERLKRETDLAALVRSRGVELKEQGRDLVGLCPLHDDHTPSLLVTPAKGLWHCLGCGKGGTVVDWVMETEKVSFRHAVEILRSGGPPPSFGAPARASTVMRLAPAVELDAEDQELMRQVLDYYHATLKSSAEGLAYLKKRGLDSPEAVSTFKLGYANRTLGLRLPPKHREDGLRVRHRLTKLGLYRPTGREHFNGSLVIPVFDEHGNAVEVYGRKIRDDLRPGTAYHLYLPGPHRGVWNLEAFRVSKEIVLAEALLDALTFYCAGFPNVTASYGVNGFTPDHLEVMKAYGTERVLIAYDRDEAGDRAAAELSERLASEGITTFRVLFPHGLDANDYALKVKPPAQALAVLLRGAQYMAGPLRTLSVVRGPLSDPPTPAPPSDDEGPPPDDEGPPPSGPSPPAGQSPPADQAPPAPEAAGQQLPSLAAGLAGRSSPDPPPAPAPPGQPPPTPGAPHPTSHAPQATSPASPIPPPPRPAIPAEVTDQQVVLRLSDRYWRVRGLAKNLSFEQLRVNLFVGLDHQADRFHQDTVELYSAKQRGAFVRQAAAELGMKEETVKKDVGTVLLKLEEVLELQIRNALEAKAQPVLITDADKEAALELLKDPRLLERVVEDFERCGVVGERTNKLVGYLAAVSRKLDRPLAVMVQSSSAAGKSALMNAVLSFVPEEERVAYSAMTGQSLFYMGEADLKHKVLAIAEEEGAERASYALKQLQSEGELTIASTGKDPSTGRLVTHEYRVQGPTAILTTTTAIDLDEELLNRCLVLTVNEDREQTRAIHRWQREAETLEGYHAELDREQLLKLHRNAQRLLRPLRVVNPLAPRLTFLDAKTRTRRDHLKYLALIRTIALLHQHQRPVLSGEHRGKPAPYVEVTLADIEVANRLAAEVLGRTLDELPPQTRRFLLLLEEMERLACQEKAVERPEHRFTARQVREHTGWGATQVKIHLQRLAEMEYLVVHRSGRGQGFVYELLYQGEGQQGEPFLMGLLDVEALRKARYDANRSASEAGWSGEKGEWSGSGRPLVGPWSGGSRTPESGQEANGEGHSDGSTPESAQKALYRERGEPGPYVAERRSPTEVAANPVPPTAAAEPVDQEEPAAEEPQQHEEEDGQQPLPLAAGSERGGRS